MIGVVATLTTAEGKGPDLEKVFADLAAKVKANESGCLMYQLTKSRTEPNTYKVLEMYASQDALTAHGLPAASRTYLLRRSTGVTSRAASHAAA